ncbi:CHAT domain-containing protein [Fulvivirgaceae bacterium BMA12]|uniref:CHAT domain-containing protein n=1 Tax=Agaribacillus aureus TaxID=3051825 RepID=A0ABT8L0Y6_9BACT|nr:CHAT domain-containing protein [Fulvivirgaceae bacterium BMA12]
MIRLSFCFTLIHLLLSFDCAAQKKNIKQLYQEAESYFNTPSPTAHTDSVAIKRYLQTASLLSHSKENALMLFNCYERAGILKQELGFDHEALGLFKKAIDVCLKFKLGDSLLYNPYVYSGNSYYYLHNFDSAKYYLTKAENSLPQNQDAHLYNSFGVLHFEAGNYTQSINHFAKALEMAHLEGNVDKDLSIFKNNIASALRRLELYDSAIVIYKDILNLGIRADEININLGMVFLEKQEPDSTLLYLSKVEDSIRRKSVVYHNKIGHAYFLKGNYTLAEKYLQKSLITRTREGKYDRIGFAYKLLGDIYYKKNDYHKALDFYQQSIIQLDYDFNEDNILLNPKNFDLGFSNFSLFESLVAKAMCLYDLYGKNNDDKYLSASINTFGAAFRKADFINKSFDNEDARLFIGQKVFKAYQEGVQLLLKSYKATGHKKYLENAFYWAEKSKATALAVSLKENQIKSYSDLPDSLLEQERNLKFNLSRLFLKIDNTENEEEIEVLKIEVRDIQVALSRLQDKLHDYPEYYRKKFSYDSVALPFLQNKVLDRHSALLSYFNCDTSIVLFVLTNSDLKCHQVPIDDSYLQSLQRLEKGLRHFAPGKAYQGSADSKHLYQRLILPVKKDLSGKETVIIIPHQRLNNLPFEVLENESGDYFVKDYGVIYQYAASFLTAAGQRSVDLQNALIVAPFTEAIKGAENGIDSFLPLPFSSMEADLLGGKRLDTKEATKSNFLKYKDSVAVIHLATHSIANSEDPSRSFIAFHPDLAKGNNYKLFAHELYNTSMSQTRLAFLSACETAQGKLISGEGIMSLSRAFAYAGCPSMVTSLWKAEDHATAFISQRFYTYLREGQGFAQALKLAKIDLMQDPDYAQFHSPSYWSHLVFVGSPQASGSSQGLWYYVIIGSIVAGVFVFVILRRFGRTS